MRGREGGRRKEEGAREGEGERKGRLEEEGGRRKEERAREGEGKRKARNSGEANDKAGRKGSHVHIISMTSLLSCLDNKISLGLIEWL